MAYHRRVCHDVPVTCKDLSDDSKKLAIVRRTLM